MIVEARDLPSIELCRLISNTPVLSLKGDPNFLVENLVVDSRIIEEGDSGVAFLALKGANNDGHSYIPRLLEMGVKAFIVSDDVDVPDDVTLVKVEDTRKALSDIASVFYNNPSEKMKVVGVTGTKGKTTITNLITEILERTGNPTGLIGTISYKLPDKIITSKNTTPESIDLQSLLYQMESGGQKHVVMEVSSHAIALGRIANVDFDVAVLTNLTRDHLDFHKTFENYVQTKAKLFEMLGSYGEHEGKIWPKVAVVNVDDEHSDTILKAAERSGSLIYTYSCREDKGADFTATDIHIDKLGIKYTLNTSMGNGPFHVESCLVGKFNVYNTLAALIAVFALKVDFEDSITALKLFNGVPGRFQSVDAGQPFRVIVDYAHSPDSLENVLRTVKELVGEGRIITVFGCGGDRDRGKRAVMGRISSEISDYTIITSDNPRTEDPEFITGEIAEGIDNRAADRYEIVQDRREAIERAIEMAEDHDIVVIAGKGHETYQIFRDRTIHFDDVEEAVNAIKKLVK